MQLDPLVKPRSVAIVGATDRPGPGRSVVESLGAIGFTGAIYPVNPKYQTVLNHVCYPSLTDLPEAPDVVVFSIRNPLVPEQVRLAVKRGARAAVIYDTGFAELGEDGARLQDEIAGLCREAGMPVCGPNCMGILNPTARVTTYKQTVMNTDGLAGNVGFISQSGSVCIAMLSDLRRYGISLSVSAGNEAVTRTVDYLEYLIDDPATKVIAHLHRDRARARALRRCPRPRGRRRQAGGRAQGRTHGAHATRDHQPHRRARRGIARVLGNAARASRDRGQRPRRDDRGAGGLPGRALAARPGNFGHHRLRRPRRDDPRQCHRRGPRPASALGRGARRGGTRDRPHHRRWQPVRRLGQRQLRRQPAACDVGRGPERAHRRRRLLRRHQQRRPCRASRPHTGKREDAGGGRQDIAQALLPHEFAARRDEHAAGQGHARSGPRPDRRHAAGSRRDRPHRPLHDAAKAAADTHWRFRRATRRCARRKGGPAHHQRVRCRSGS